MEDVPKKKIPIKVKWVFKTNHMSNGTIAKNKDKLVAKEFTQKEGIEE